MNEHISIIILVCAICIVVSMIGIFIWILKSPFKYPYKIIKIDISKKRSPKILDLIDTYLIDNGLSDIYTHCNYVKKWKKECQNKIALSKLRKRRTQQYLRCLDDNNMFVFEFIRIHTRYMQRNYVKIPYKVVVKDKSYSLSFNSLNKRYAKLKEIGFACTISEYNSNQQRRLMTKELRERIAIRDNYTCQICGKYMPDGVGLHIDHIVPISKGGKSIPANLQVLCSKCNGKKSSK